MIGVGEVVGAIRHARAFEPDEGGEPGTGLPEAQQIRTRKRLITARTLGQSEQFWRVADANDAMNPPELTAEIGRILRVPVPEA